MRTAMAALNTQKFAEGEAALRQVLSVDPDHVEANLTLGVLAGKTARPDIAIDHLKRVIERSPENFVALNWLSMLYREKGNHKDALGYSERAADLKPGDP